ncbi:MAG: hypothetical protein JSW60_05435 [Thermoplasmatales archaeon]|nr:MAG: hypothetical protein JSW60_05435 [Thermoplasmatales archaeon]
MKQQLAILIIATLLICFCLTGCEEEVEVTGDNKVDIIDYSVTTKWYIPGYGTFQTYSKPGFYKHYPENAYEPRYIVSGTAKNIAGEDLKQFVITVLFCDSNGNQLASENIIIRDLYNTYTKTFVVNHTSSNQYFKNIDRVKFHISVS